MSDWQTLSSETIYETHWIKVRRDQALNHKGQETTFSVISLQHPSVNVIATNEQGELFIQKNFRYPVGKALWDIPAGGSDGEDAVVAAKRELLEEAGLTSEKWVELGNYYSATGTSNMPGTIFWAQNAHKVTESCDDEEMLSEQQFMPVEEFEKLVQKGHVTDASVLSALYLFKLYREKHNV
ncbi:MAG: NUDIX hydrolase [Patescibacteria group bacterium]|nr:NUDIX hydrolase [Patescibacteria group bacterium]